MKIIRLLVAFLLLTAARGNCQVVLQGGDWFTYQFTNLVFQNNSTTGIAGPSGAVFLYVEPSDPARLGPTNSYKVEMFEDTTAQAPFLVRTITDASSVFDIDYRATNVWGDLQGSIRVTALTGSVTLHGFSFQAIKQGNPDGFDVFGTDRIFLPAPPLVSVVSSGSKITFSWPETGTNFVPEKTSSLIPPVSWSPVSNAVVSDGGTQSVAIG